jgi:PhoH-like ATPase
MTAKASTKRKLFVLDTNVLMHDPSSIFRFEEHDLFIPMYVLEELDAAKKGTSEVSRNARQVSRFFEQLMRDKTHKQIAEGLALPSIQNQASGKGSIATGHLYFQTQALDATLTDVLPGNKADNNILKTALALKTKFSGRPVILVSKDINLRIKSAIVGVPTEDYHNDQVLDDLKLLYSGHLALPANFWQTHGDKMESWHDNHGRVSYRIKGPLVKK